MARASLLAVPCFAAWLLAAASARADEPGTPVYPEYFVREEVPFKSFALEANPLAVAIGRFSMNVEYMIAPHHGAVVSPHYYWALPGQDDEITGGGVEAGYRYYTGKDGPHGLFFGVSFLYGKYRYIYRKTGVAAGTCIAFQAVPDCPDDTSYDAFGAALDAGYQVILRDHVLLGAGAGIQYQAFTTQPSYERVSGAHQDTWYGSGLRPRVLLTIGGAL